MKRSLARTSLGVLGWLCAATPAGAVTATLVERASSVRGEPASFRLEVTGAAGNVQVRWDWGDETRTEFTVDDLAQTHTYPTPGHYAVLATVKDDAGFTSVSFVHAVHEPLVEGIAAVSSDLAYDRKNGRIYVANEDNASVSAVDVEARVKLAELPVAPGPVALALWPGGKLWVLHRAASSISIVDVASLSVERELALPGAAQPLGLAVSPRGDVAYVSLMARGQLLELDAQGSVLRELDVGPTPRGVSVTHDGASVLVTRFISDDAAGEVIEVAADTFQVTRRYALAADETTLDSDQRGRGLPNYLFSVGLSPDGLFGWVPAKKDNVFRGIFRDELPLNADNTVRPLVALLDLRAGRESVGRRIDLDDRNLPNQVVFSPLGDYAFVSVAGSALVEVRDAYTGGFVTALKEAGFAPRGLVLTDEGLLFAHASLSRSLVAYDVKEILSSVDFTTRRVAEVSTVQNEALPPELLRGKQLFYNSADVRMSDQGYLSCASCHFDGADDGRVWDFGSLGEGLRNTISLLGRRGMGHGRLNWSGSHDELQDIDDNIRELFGGTGFLTAEQRAALGGAPGAKKAGLSPELDALAAYVSSLSEPRPSPFRNPDGSLTSDGVAGRAIYRKLGCDFCHTGDDTTDSAGGRRHDVGTLSADSGQASFGALLGLDTPTLNGIWETPPYLHDGSAATLRDVLTTRNPDDQHGFVSALSEPELTQLLAYVRQLDGSPDPEATGDGGANAGSSAGGSAAAGNSSGGSATTGSAAPRGGTDGCSIRAAAEKQPRRWLWGGLGVAWLCRRRWLSRLLARR